RNRAGLVPPHLPGVTRCMVAAGAGIITTRRLRKMHQTGPRVHPPRSCATAAPVCNSVIHNAVRAITSGSPGADRGRAPLLRAVRPDPFDVLAHAVIERGRGRPAEVLLDPRIARH